MKTIACQHLFDTYEALLLDAYGVLVDASGVLPHAVEFIAALRRHNKPFYIVTNDASRLPGVIAARFVRLGLPIAAEQIITSVSLLVRHFAAANLQGAKTLVLGPPDAQATVSEAGGVPLGPKAIGTDLRAVVVCDAGGENLMADVECAIDAVVAACRQGRPMDLILCNPDLIYPRGPGRFGLTSGSTMLLIEAALKTCLTPQQMPKVTRLGKPYAGIFDEAVRRAGTRKVALVGDQLGTDILGAKTYGIDAILIGTGLTQVGSGVTLEPEPDCFLPTLELPLGY